MKRFRDCTQCGRRFDIYSQAKREAGGLIDHCHECADETEVRYLGLQVGSGKVNGCEIVSLPSEARREEFLENWKLNAGYDRGKACQIGGIRPTVPHSFRKIASFGGNDNSK